MPGSIVTNCLPCGMVPAVTQSHANSNFNTRAKLEASAENIDWKHRLKASHVLSHHFAYPATKSAWVKASACAADQGIIAALAIGIAAQIGQGYMVVAKIAADDGFHIHDFHSSTTTPPVAAA